VKKRSRSSSRKLLDRLYESSRRCASSELAREPYEADRYAKPAEDDDARISITWRVAVLVVVSTITFRYDLVSSLGGQRDARQ